ncbi:hypothetical protein PIB30_082600 [Stylosanthes scabra]|uniref:DNA-directed RNA polymerase III subunit n=1 Tax=Stylosanthes scabra TaxID=79078 RepID=A0ABU6RSE5_9FABA|nr:hypothetical protein [Stylosanthes scabra]
MASRGRGRGRGGGGGRFGMIRWAKEVEFELFPEDVTLPSNKVNSDDTLMKDLLRRNARLQNYWKASPYIVEETGENKRMHVERFSDRNKTTFTRDCLSQILVFKEFPKELVRGTARRPSRKKFRWNPETGENRLDFFEQLEKKNQGKEGTDEKENKEGENEEEEENVDDEEVEDEEEFGDDDYQQNEYFDDDEDDYNDVDEGDDEGVY